MDAKYELWLMLAREKYPKLTDKELMMLSLQAASHWYVGDKDELSELYDQYVILKVLKNIPSNANDEKDLLGRMRGSK